MEMSALETVASEFHLPTDGGIFIIVGPKHVGKSSIIKKPDLHIKSGVELKDVEKLLSEFIATKSSKVSSIVFDEINAKFYKTGYFKSVCASCEDTNVQLFLITQNMRDLPPLVRNKALYWFLFKMNNNYLGFPPLNRLSSWVEPSHHKYTAIVVKFGDGKPGIWWYNSHGLPKPKPKPGQSSQGSEQGNPALQSGKTTSISDILSGQSSGAHVAHPPSHPVEDQPIINIYKNILELKQTIDTNNIQAAEDIGNLHEAMESHFEKIYKMLVELDQKVEDIAYEDD